MSSATQMNPGASLAIIAGGGVFPKLIAHKLALRGVEVFIVHLEGDSTVFHEFPEITARPEQLGYIFTELRKRNIRDLVLIGRMHRPRILDLRPDWFTIKLLPRIAWELCFGGDDALLKSVRQMLEKQGFQLHAVQNFVEGLTAPAGLFGGKNPESQHLEDIRIGMDAAREHGARDAGQAVVVHQGRVIARESARGTDAMIGKHPVPGAVLVKMAKPQQDRALDLPSIGPDTVRACVQAGYAGIAVEAGATLVAGRDETIALANDNGLFLMGIK